jgi:hypothetical protein
VPAPPDNGEGRAPHSERPGPTPTATTAILPDQGDPRRIGELLGDWLAIQMDRVDALVAEAEAKVAAIPDQRVMWSLTGEVIVLLRSLELEVAELRKAIRG